MRVSAAPFAGHASDGPPAAAHVRDAELTGGHLGHAAILRVPEALKSLEFLG